MTISQWNSLEQDREVLRNPMKGRRRLNKVIDQAHMLLETGRISFPNHFGTIRLPFKSFGKESWYFQDSRLHPRHIRLPTTGSNLVISRGAISFYTGTAKEAVVGVWKVHLDATMSLPGGGPEETVLHHVML